MRLIPSDPDIETLLRRIEDGELDLQPDFQRGEVWSKRKKRLLIDSILRRWHVPPIHVVETRLGEEVLDGQQRLAAIRDFYQGKIRVDGDADPPDEHIKKLHNLSYHDLPHEYQKRFLRFGIRIFKIVDYSAQEPAELFYRLNQPVTLTTPEQRNAFFGPVRDEVRRIVESFTPQVFDSDFLGFSNSRMAWDDVVARVCYSIEDGSLRSKITATRLANRYRDQYQFPSKTISAVENAFQVMAAARPSMRDSIRFNKATLFTWLCFFACAEGWRKSDGDAVGGLVTLVEVGRQDVRHSSPPQAGGRVAADTMARLLLLYHDRASSRVGDVFSVLVRDFVVWTAFFSYAQSLDLEDLLQRNRDKIRTVERVVSRLQDWDPHSLHDGSDEAYGVAFQESLESLLSEVEWGSLR